MPKVCLFGPDGGGKTTFANSLGYEVRSFANPVKEAAHSIVGREPIDREDKEKNFRDVYRSVGQRAKELYGEDVWAKKMDIQGDSFVIDDGRFNVELERMKANDIITVYVNMTGAEGGCEVDYHDCDFIIDDDENRLEMQYFLMVTLDELESGVPPKILSKPVKDEPDITITTGGIIIFAMFIIGCAFTIYQVISFIIKFLQHI